VLPKAVVTFREQHIVHEISRRIGPEYRCRPLRRYRCRLLGRYRCRPLGRYRCRRFGRRARRWSRRANRRSPSFDARNAHAAPANRSMHCAVPMVPGRVAKTAEHRPGCQHSEHRGWTKSQSRVRIEGRASDKATAPRMGIVHGRMTVLRSCRFSFNCRVLEKVPAATPGIGIAEKTTPGIPDAGRCLGMRRNAMICDIGAGHR